MRVNDENDDADYGNVAMTMQGRKVLARVVSTFLWATISIHIHPYPTISDQVLPYTPTIISLALGTVI